MRLLLGRDHCPGAWAKGAIRPVGLEAQRRQRHLNFLRSCSDGFMSASARLACSLTSASDFSFPSVVLREASSSSCRGAAAAAARIFPGSFPPRFLGQSFSLGSFSRSCLSLGNLAGRLAVAFRPRSFDTHLGQSQSGGPISINAAPDTRESAMITTASEVLHLRRLVVGAPSATSLRCC